MEHILDGVKLGAEVIESRVGKKGIIRELESDIVMSVDAAKRIVDWLNEKIKMVENLDVEGKK